ncbi:tryptophan-rich sensory protein [Amycolatopsis sp. NBRC 101858]|uniref:TspO/MBR family protein n=1 Tax=Amycolatopsis sp. NBRC 101858 TaxID=3032200 RepID=UPI0024A13057|nr:TspO/MBR family protein [Amycolatopsis sp. NBRC 101858]GLY41903.1 tryptophan-rich sensory protein [Amycolatopsis sp. NBRC 101858]
MTTVHRSAPAPVVLAGFLAAVAVVAVVGGFAASSSREVYAGLEQPPWAPPSWLFGPVWTVLYVLIAVSGWLYWRAGGTRTGFAWYAVGLVLNAAWTPLFFAAGAYTLALVEIVLLDIAVAGALTLFWRRSRVAAALQVPYLTWTVFATALNAAIVVLN